MEEKAERQFWEFEKTRMKLEQEQEERWRKDDQAGGQTIHGQYDDLVNEPYTWQQ